MEPEATPLQDSPPAAAEDAASFFRQLGEQTSKVLTAAEEAGRGIREQARRDAAGILAEARIQAEELARVAATQRRAAEEELRRFRAARTVLANQIEDVHRRLEEIILRLRTPVEAPDVGAGAEEVGVPAPAVVAVAPAPVVPAAVAAATVGPVAVVAEAPAEAPAEPEALAQDEVALGLESEEPLGVVQPVMPVIQSVIQPELGAGLDGPPGTPEELRAFAERAQGLGEGPVQAGRSLKRLLQEDQNDLLDRIRRHRGKGTFEQDIFPATEQVERFVHGLRTVLEPAFLAGRRLAGGPAVGEPDTLASGVVAALVSKQVVAPLRRDLGRMLEPRLAAGDTATTVSERAGDVYRVWKGVRTELLGEGLVYAAYHHGLLDAWREAHRPAKRWAMSNDEADCPRDTCKVNAAAGSVPLEASFPSGHLAPPAHGACTCTVIAAPV